MLGLGSWAPLVLSYVVQLALSLTACWAFWRWLLPSDLDRPMRIMVLGIILLNASVAIQVGWFGIVRWFGWTIPPDDTVMILIPLKIAVIIATYMHIHAFLVYRAQIYGDAKRWRIWCIGGPLVFVIVSLFLM